MAVYGEILMAAVKLRGTRRRGPDVEVQLRSLRRYDELIPA